MKKCFNNVQMFKSSEVCDKFSKSVSYETLVIGATTTGREYKQTRRLFLSSADKPLSAVGTLTSLLCNSAKVMEKLLHRHSEPKAKNPKNNIKYRILRFANASLRMTIPALAFIFTLATTTESSAETWDCGEIANTVSCSLDENGVFTISGTGKMKDYQTYRGYVNSPWGSANIQTVVVGKGVTSVGNNAFYNAYNLTNITIPDSVTSIGIDAFNYARSLTNIMCKGDETSCADTVNALRAAGYTGNISYPTDKTSCEGSDISLYVWNGSKCGRRNEEQCNSVAKYYYSDGKCQVLPKTQSACTGTNIEWNATDNKCVNKNYTPTGGDDIGDVSGDFNPADCYNNGQVPYNNQCWDEYPFAKKRWTPAEANEWLHDGNDNFVVITFKK